MMPDQLEEICHGFPWLPDLHRSQRQVTGWDSGLATCLEASLFDAVATNRHVAPAAGSHFGRMQEEPAAIRVVACAHVLDILRDDEVGSASHKEPKRILGSSFHFCPAEMEVGPSPDEVLITFCDVKIPFHRFQNGS